jgi:hypothetical protein
MSTSFGGSAATAAANRTVSRTWRAQYEGSVACAAVMGAPVVDEMNGKDGARSLTRATRSPKAPRMGSIIDEWKACEVRSLRQATPSLASRASSASMRSPGPEATQSAGALTAAMSSPSPRRARSWSSGSRTLSIDPAGSDWMSAPRAATSRRASSSPKTPARQAATYSPTLCPTMARGSTPSRRQSRASAYSMTKSAGCVTTVCASLACAAASVAGVSKSSWRRSKPSSGASTWHERSTSARKGASAR